MARLVAGAALIARVLVGDTVADALQTVPPLWAAAWPDRSHNAVLEPILEE